MVEMAAKLGINMQALFKNEKERALAFLFSLDTSKFKNWHNEVKNRVTEAPDTRKGVLQAARKRSDKGDWTPEPKKPDAAFIAAEERRRERDAPQRYQFLKREDWAKLTPDEQNRRKACMYTHMEISPLLDRKTSIHSLR